MKRLLLSLLMTVFVFSVSACDDSSSTTTNTGTAPALTAVEDASLSLLNVFDVTGKTSATVSYTEVTPPVDYDGYSLDQFVPAADANALFDSPLADCRVFFSVLVDASDHYNARAKNNYDLTWAQFITGYYLPDNETRTFFPSTDIPKNFDTKYAYDIYLFQKVDVKRADATVVTFEVGALTLTTGIQYKNNSGSTTYTEDGISLTQIITDYVTSSHSSYKYRLIAADGWVNGDSDLGDASTEDVYSWGVLQKAYYVPNAVTDSNNGAIVFPPDNIANLNPYKKKKWITTIELIAL